MHSPQSVHAAETTKGRHVLPVPNTEVREDADARQPGYPSLSTPDHLDQLRRSPHQESRAGEALASPEQVRSTATVGASHFGYRGQALVDHLNSQCNGSGHLAVKQRGAMSCQAGPTGELAGQTNR